ncbi:small RNA 2'-O-methyltransferase-like [Babylonia areolata]|uniref:small RNA 2'-O-methyltransferase-like n=1 Tax=Babylonia areolata TaxID=304850 RepID=UPI003FD1F802
MFYKCFTSPPQIYHLTCDPEFLLSSTDFISKTAEPLHQCCTDSIAAFSKAMSTSTDLGEERCAGADGAGAPQPNGCQACHHEEEGAAGHGGPKFNPPVYSQRYALVQDVLRKHCVESVVDFGCAECKIIYFLKNVESMRRIALVDADLTVLKGGCKFVQPSVFEHVIPRPTPLRVSLFHGSAGDLDSRVAGVQAASLVELIEHLEPDVLEKVTHNVFGCLRPRLVIVTTPNADFNVLFPGFSGFRHWDHKFEWTREQFQQWCEGLCRQHGYAVSYTGAGDPPPQHTHLGFCSQAAIFTEASEKAGQQTEEKVYKLVHEEVYPYDQRTDAERLGNEIDYTIHRPCLMERYMSEDRAQIIIPVAHLMDHILNQPRSAHETKWTEGDVLGYLRSKYTVTDDGTSVVIQLQEDDSGSSQSSGDFSHHTEDNRDDLCPQLVERSCVEEEVWD